MKFKKQFFLTVEDLQRLGPTIYSAIGCLNRRKYKHQRRGQICLSGYDGRFYHCTQLWRIVLTFEDPTAFTRYELNCPVISRRLKRRFADFRKLLKHLRESQANSPEVER